MTPFPLPLQSLLGTTGMYLVYLVIGFAFGFVLEISGFNHSPTLAAQFYFKDLRVLKVMFTAIIVAMVLIFATSGLGLLDYNLIWVNPTYLWSGILGGLIMGVGFIVGGFCPGTSIVAAATLKIDGIIFAVGALVGVTLFGETEALFSEFYNGSYYGRVTLMDFLHLPTGVVVLLVVLMALFMFWGGEQLEQIIGKKDLSKEPRQRYYAAGAIVVAALAVLVIGQPTTADKWARMELEKESALNAREVQIHPGELLDSMYNNQLKVVILDLRSESDYNLFHIRDSRRVDPATLEALAPKLILDAAANTVHVLVDNNEKVATQAWRTLVALSVPNVYILEGGINGWLDVFASENPEIQPTATPSQSGLRYTFPAALGERYDAANPNPHHWELEYTPKIKLQLKRGPAGGGCG